MPIKSVKGAAVTNIIVNLLAVLELDIGKIRAQCYDGAANMAGKYSGVASQNSPAEPRSALYKLQGTCS